MVNFPLERLCQPWNSTSYCTRKSNCFFIFYISLQILSLTSIFALLWPDYHFKLTPRCRTLKVPKVGVFSPYLRVTTFWGFEIYTQKCMTLRDFDNFLFFPWIRWFLCASLHATDFSKKWCKTKWSRFYINERAFVNLTAFCVRKQYFS